jgi:Golgi SNAP receptor complex protein 1
MTEQGASSSLSWDEEATLQQEIQRLLSHLQDLITSRLTQAARSPSQKAVVGRYRDILLDLRGDLEKSHQTVRRAAERRELLQGSSAATIQSGTDPSMDHLLRERKYIDSSVNVARDVLGQAEGVRKDLYVQGRGLRNTQGLLGALTTNIPGLNTVVDRIRRLRSRDDMIVAGSIATCILFTLWYIFG